PVAAPSTASPCEALPGKTATEETPAALSAKTSARRAASSRSAALKALPPRGQAAEVLMFLHTSY
ncbi:hypothetical protein HMPREF0972_01031, partial [Actinomyces sp. oral taxon 848 str. F0332]